MSKNSLVTKLIKSSYDNVDSNILIYDREVSEEI